MSKIIRKYSYLYYADLIILLLIIYIQENIISASVKTPEIKLSPLSAAKSFFKKKE